MDVGFVLKVVVCWFCFILFVVVSGVGLWFWSYDVVYVCRWVFGYVVV